MIWRLNQVPAPTARGKGRLEVQEIWSGLPEWLPLPAGRLIPAIIQDAASGMVLMLVDLNQEALELMAATGRVHYYHPAKRKVVAKGEASGHFQDVVEIRLVLPGGPTDPQGAARRRRLRTGLPVLLFPAPGPRRLGNRRPQGLRPGRGLPGNRLFALEKIGGRARVDVPALPPHPVLRRATQRVAPTFFT